MKVLHWTWIAIACYENWLVEGRKHSTLYCIRLHDKRGEMTSVMDRMMRVKCIDWCLIKGSSHCIWLHDKRGEMTSVMDKMARMKCIQWWKFLCKIWEDVVISAMKWPAIVCVYVKKTKLEFFLLAKAGKVDSS